MIQPGTIGLGFGLGAGGLAGLASRGSGTFGEDTLMGTLGDMLSYPRRFIWGAGDASRAPSGAEVIAGLRTALGLYSSPEGRGPLEAGARGSMGDPSAGFARGYDAGSAKGPGGFAGGMRDESGMFPWGDGPGAAMGGEGPPATEGSDPGDMTNRALGTLLEMVLDPLTLATGGFAGIKSAMQAGRVARFTRPRAALAEELAGIDEAAKVARTAVPTHAKVGYRPEIIDELPDWPSPRTYRRFDPAVAAMANDAGIGYTTPATTINDSLTSLSEGLHLMGQPSFAKGAGGYMKAVPGVEPNVRAALPNGYLSALAGPGADDIALGQSRLPLSRHLPDTLEQARLERMLGRAAPAMKMMPQEALPFLENARKATLEQQGILSQVGFEDPTLLEKMLLGMGYDPLRDVQTRNAIQRLVAAQ